MSLRGLFAFDALVKVAGTVLLGMFVMLSAGSAQAMRLGGDERPFERVAGFDGVGRLECLIPGGKAAVRDATGWIVASGDTVVTAAHTLFSDGQAIDPKDCIFRLLNADGSGRETARVRYIRSPWSEASHRGDSAHDIAVLKLERPMRGNAIAPVATGRGATARLVELVSLPGDARDPRVRISDGEARPFPLGVLHDRGSGMHVTDPSLLFATSADSAEGSSGGLYFAAGSGAAIGLHVGYVCAGPDGCFNFGLRFDAGLLTTIAAVAMDDSGKDAVLLAIASLPQGLH